MTPADVDQAKVDLKRLRELESAFGDLEHSGCVRVSAFQTEYGFGMAEHLAINVRDVGHITTPIGLEVVQAIARAAYEAEIATIKARLQALGVEIGRPREAKAA